LLLQLAISKIMTAHASQIFSLFITLSKSERLFSEQAGSEYQGKEEQNNKYKKQKFGYRRGTCRNACESEDRRYQCDNEEG
jgi:hypothetical protein